jgi:hypothetical protein
MSRFGEFLRRLFVGRPAEPVSERMPPAFPAATTPKSKPGHKPGSPSFTRRLHLGVDFGTCWSKLVLRDLESPQPRCFVVRPPATFKGKRDFRIPSSLVFDENRFFFGWVALGRAKSREAVVYESPKMRAAFGHRYGLQPAPLPPGFLAEDLATLVVAYLLEIGRWAGSDYTRQLPNRPQAKLSMTMGVPMSMLDSEHLADRFLSIARVAFELYRSFPGAIQDGISADEALGFLKRAKEIVAGKGDVQDPRDWIRSEAEAGLLWVFRSPEVGDGLYACADVGAGTTDVSFFRIGSSFEAGSWQKSGMQFYSAESRPPGVDAIDGVLVTAGTAASVTDARGNESTLIASGRLSNSAELAEITTGVFSVYQDAWRQAYKLERSERHWHDYRLFVMGGGSKVDCIVSSLGNPAWDQLGPRRPGDPGLPRDLYEWGLPPRVFQGEPTFLLVAYGLSFLAPDTPPAKVPAEMPPWEPLRHTRQPVDQDEYYPP